MATIIHMADSHLGRVSFGKLIDSGANLRETLIYENFLDGIENIIDAHPDAVVHAGDLFDTVKPKTQALLTVMTALDRLKDNDIPFVGISGNHSMPKNSYTPSAFEVLKKAHPEIHVAYSFRYEHIHVNGIHFHLIPNMLRAEDYKKAALDATAYNKEPGRHVLVTHGLTSTIRDKRLSTVAEFELTPEVLADSYDYIALGHYHGQMQVGPNAWYSGSQEHLTYGEIKDKKGALLVDLNMPHAPEHFDLPKTPMRDLGTVYCVGLTWGQILEDIRDALSDLPKGIMAQLTIDFQDQPVRAVPVEALAEIREHLLDLKIRIRSQETERQETSPQDLHAIDYVVEFERFVEAHSLSNAQRGAVTRLGQEALRTAIAQHSEEGQ